MKVFKILTFSCMITFSINCCSGEISSMISHLVKGARKTGIGRDGEAKLKRSLPSWSVGVLALAINPKIKLSPFDGHRIDLNLKDPEIKYSLHWNF